MSKPPPETSKPQRRNRPKRRRETAKTGKTVRGRPFRKGQDVRRNVKGRGKTAQQNEPYEITLAALLAPVTTVSNGVRQKKPKLRVVLDQQLAPATQGDQQALRAAATLIRAVAALRRPPDPAQPEDQRTSHDETLLDELLTEYETRVIEADRMKRRKKKDGDDDDQT